MVDRDVLVDILQRMVRIRKFEEAIIALQNTGYITGGVHVCIGQEGEIAGAIAALEPDDYMTGTHRSHGHMVAKGSRPGPLIAELLGRAGGICGGKGGSMHLADFSVGCLGASGIVGAAMPIATGAGLASQIRADGRVTLCFFGDGAAHEGAAHEAINLAAVWNLPVVFLCENNLYAATVPLRQMMKSPDVAARAQGYGIPGVIVDGQDAVTVYEAVSTAAERCRSGGGPTLIEAKTYRFHEHALKLNLAFKVPYRTDEEVARWSERDPIDLLRTRLLSDGQITTHELDSLESAVTDEMARAVAWAKDSKLPDPSEAYTDVYTAPLSASRRAS